MPSLITLAKFNDVISSKTRPRPVTLLVIIALITLTAITLLTAKSIQEDKELTLDTEKKNALFAV